MRYFKSVLSETVRRHLKLIPKWKCYSSVTTSDFSKITSDLQDVHLKSDPSSNSKTHICVKKKNATVKTGDKVVVKRHILQEDVDRFAEVVGDYNPVHFARDSSTKPIVHGAFLNGIVSGVIGTKLPGPGTLVVSQTLNFPNPCYVGEEVIVEVEITSVRKIIACKYSCMVHRNKEVVVMHGDAKLIANK